MLCRRIQVAGPLILERRRLHTLLLCVQDLAAHLGEGSADRGPPSAGDSLAGVTAQDLPGLEANLQLASHDFLVRLRAAIRKRLVELKSELNQPPSAN